MLVYLICNKINGKKYVGKTVRKYLSHRWGNHLCSMRKGAPTVLHRAMRKYGQANFALSVLGRFETAEQLSLAEQLFIAELGTKSPSGYNLTDGGEGTLGRPHSPETRAKIKAKHPRNWLGKHHSEETKQKMREASSRRSRSAAGAFL